MCLPPMISIALASFVCAFCAIVLLSPCWHRVVQLDFFALACNIIAASQAHKAAVDGAAWLHTRWKLAAGFYFPWVSTAYLQGVMYTCGTEARDAFFTTRLAFFFYRTAFAIPLMCPLHCSLGELICCTFASLQTSASETLWSERTIMIVVELAFLMIMANGMVIAGQGIIKWGTMNAYRAEAALGALLQSEHALIEKLCDAEVKLSADFRMLSPSKAWAALTGHDVKAIEDGCFLSTISVGDRERARAFLENVNEMGASKCVHVTLKGAGFSGPDVRIYHAAHSGIEDMCQHRLAIIALRTGCPDADDAVQEAFAGSPVEPPTASRAWTGGAFSESGSGTQRQESSQAEDGVDGSSISDTLIFSESAVTGSAMTGSAGSLCSWRHESKRRRPGGLSRARSPSQREVTNQLKQACDVAIQTDPALPPRPPRPPLAPTCQPKQKARMQRYRGKPAVSGCMVDGKKTIPGETARLHLIEIAKKLNVSGSGCCKFHIVFAYLQKQTKHVLTQLPCRNLSFNKDWQCRICLTMHSFDEEVEEDDGQYWCDVCGSTETPEPDVSSEVEDSRNSHVESDLSAATDD